MVLYSIYFFDILNLIVDFGTLLIGAEGAKTLAGGRGRGDPAGAQRRGGSPDRPRKAKRLERKLTGMFNRAIFLKGHIPFARTNTLTVRFKLWYSYSNIRLERGE
ncbi:hypothetical protein CN481_06230 [Bacillus sp. AFS006103]|nr:hypothetical protein CN481_06230 [Bacillus sp. AFS006103]